MAERAHRERDIRPCERPNDGQEAARLAVWTLFSAIYAEIDGEDIVLAKPSAMASPVYILADWDVERRRRRVDMEVQCKECHTKET